MGTNKRLSGNGFRRGNRDSQAPRAYNIRVVRDHGGGLWTLEADSGQMYLAVLSRQNSERRRELEANRPHPHAGRDEKLWPVA